MRTLKDRAVSLVCLACVLLGAVGFSTVAFAQTCTEIRVGWQVPWATQGQLVQVWKHTDILARNSLCAEFIGRDFGPQLNEIALAGELDVILTADQPAAALFSKGRGWVGIGRLMYNRTVTYVPPNSPVMSMADLRGKTIGVPIGAAAERGLNEELRRAGLDPAKDVTIVNLGIREHIPLISRGSANGKWGAFDALAGFDPVPAILESDGRVRALAVSRIVSMVLMNQSFIDANPGVAERLMNSLVEAYDFYRQNVPQANLWFKEEAGLQNVSDGALAIAASIEPNLLAENQSDIRVSFTEDDFLVMQRGADFLAPIVGTLDMRDFVDNRFVPGEG